MRASADAASREGGRECVVGREDGGGVPCADAEEPSAANDVDERARTGGLERSDAVGAAAGSSARSHMAVDWDRVKWFLALPASVGVAERTGMVKEDFRLFGVGGVRPRAEPTSVEAVLEPEPSRRAPAEEAGRRRFMPMAEARERLRLPVGGMPRVFRSTSSLARTSSSAIWRTRTAPSCCTSQLMRS